MADADRRMYSCKQWQPYTRQRAPRTDGIYIRSVFLYLFGVEEAFCIGSYRFLLLIIDNGIIQLLQTLVGAGCRYLKGVYRYAGETC